MSHDTTHINGIAGLQGREPIGAVLTIGTKGENGAPTHRDRFYFKQVTADANDRRPEHPAFSIFNEAGPEKRRFIEGVIVAHKIEDVFQLSRSSQVLEKGWPSTPFKEPQCQGNGVVARRWMGEPGVKSEAGGWADIVCPGEKCKYAQGDKPACKPYCRVLLQVRWPEQERLAALGQANPSRALPVMLVKFTSRGWRTVSALHGFFDSFRRDAETFGVSDASVYGLHISLALGEKTNAAKKSRFPVVTVSTKTDVQAFLMHQLKVREQLRQYPRFAQLSDPDANTVEVRRAELLDVSGPGEAGVYAPRTQAPYGGQAAAGTAAPHDTVDVEPEPYRDQGTTDFDEE